MPASSPFPEHVYIGYLLREREKDGTLIYKPFHVTEKSFAKAKTKVEADLADHPRRVPAPGVLVYLQKTPHGLIAATNVKAFFTGPSSKDVCVGKIVTCDGGVGQFIPEPKKATKPRKLTTKEFLGYCLVNDKKQVPLVIPATGYMKARERVLRLAASIHHELPALTLFFYLRRNQLVEAGERPHALLRVPWVSECLVRIICRKGESPSIIFPNQFNKEHRPNQGRVDRSIFMSEKLDLIVKQLESEIAPLIADALAAWDRWRAERVIEEAARARRILAAAAFKWGGSDFMFRHFVADHLDATLARRLGEKEISVLACAIHLRRRGRPRKDDLAVRLLKKDLGLAPDEEVPDKIEALQRLAASIGIPRMSPDAVEDQVQPLLARLAEVRRERDAAFAELEKQDFDSLEMARDAFEDADVYASVMEDEAVRSCGTRRKAPRQSRKKSSRSRTVGKSRRNR